MQCLIPTLELVQGVVQQLFSVVLIMMEIYAEGKVEWVMYQWIVVQEWRGWEVLQCVLLRFVYPPQTKAKEQ